MKRYITVLTVIGLSLGVFAQQDAPKPVPPLPTSGQVAWQQMETYAFIHFGPNTFGNREWGYGDADPMKEFNPTRLDCEQWARTVKAAGMKGIILTAKHHDGFCLWPSKYTDYSVRNSPYKDGKGDIVGELSAACRKYGLKLGLYLSPWDRHQAFYGTPLYVEYFYAQLRELLTNYGKLFEVWFDGANGGDGYYGGAREVRTIDRRNYYDFPRAWKMIGELQPNAVIFSDNGPGCRWVGNEKGYAAATNWSLLRSKDVYPGYPNHYELQSGHEDGYDWVAAECDVSIRPGWFYHQNEDDKVKTVDHLVDLYYRSVGHNATLLINFPVNKEGLIHPVDSARIIVAHRQVANELKNNLLKNAKIKASSTRSKNFSVKNLTDEDYSSYWSTPDGVTKADLSIRFSRPQKLNRMKLQEYIPLGQRVKSFTVEYKNGRNWMPLMMNEETTTIGYCRLLRFKTIQTRELRIRFTDARGPLCISSLGAYYAPNAKDSYVEKAEDVKSLPFTTAENSDGITLDLGKEQLIRAFYYLPLQETSPQGLISNYELYTGTTPENMHLVKSGEFSNILNNPILQRIYFAPVRARYVKLKATRMVKAGEPIKYSKLGVQ